MRFLSASQTTGLQQHSPIVWESLDDDPALIYDLSGVRGPFVCFFLAADRDLVSPKLSFDHGEGFNELSAIVFRRFAFGFYHVSLATIGSATRMRLRPCEASGPFRMAVFETAQPLLVAVLHYLFNLRYQKIAMVTADPRGSQGTLSAIVANARRIRKFFSDVSVGSGVRVQQADDDRLARLRLSQSLQARPMQADMRARLAGRAAPPLISVISPIYNTDPGYLRDLLASFVAQDAPYCELILSDDGSTREATKVELARAATIGTVRVLDNGANGGIARATNAGIAGATGDWVTFIDHDDAFENGSLAAIASAILAHPDADFFYTDEIVANAALEPIGSFCKPAFDSVLLSGLNYINHFSVFRRERLSTIGGLRLDREGSQDYDLLLRYLASPRPGAIVHIPFLAYTWRRGEGTYSAVFRERSVGNARTALQAAYDGSGRAVAVEPALNPDLHRIRFVTDEPLVSVIVPNRNSLALISRLVSDLQTRTDYAPIEIVIVDNGSTDADVLAFYDSIRGEAVRAEIVPEPFNFARMCNRGARLARGDHLLFLNNDIEVREPGWLGEMVECLGFDHAGIVGAKLLYPSGKIQHAGVIVGLGEAAGHWYVEDDADEPGPMGRLAVRQTLTAVTGACMLVTTTCFDALDGFDEDAFPIAYNDIDFCVRARNAGFRTIWTPFATLLHHESASRGSDETEENKVRFQTEMGRLKARHGTATFIDDAFSPFYDRRYSQPHLILPEALPEARPNAFC